MNCVLCDKHETDSSFTGYVKIFTGESSFYWVCNEDHEVIEYYDECAPIDFQWNRLKKKEQQLIWSAIQKGYTEGNLDSAIGVVCRLPLLNFASYNDALSTEVNNNC